LLSGPSPDHFALAKRLLLLGFMSVFVLAAFASTAAVWKVVSNTAAEESTFKLVGGTTSIQLYWFALPPAVAAAAGMILMLVATLAFGWMAASALPAWFSGDFGLFRTSRLP
jgi:hypothetical protein